MAYFAVVLARTDEGWEANDVDLDEVEDLGDLADVMRESSPEAEPETTFLLFLEREDAWFAVVRVDGEDDPRVFISDDGAIEHSAYAEMLLEAAGSEAGALGVIEDLDEDDSTGEDEDADEAEEVQSGPIGDRDLLADLGTPGDDLLALCAKEGMLPSEILTALAEAAGAAEVLESVR